MRWNTFLFYFIFLLFCTTQTLVSQEFTWVKSMTNSSGPVVTSDENGNCYLAGNFSGVANFGEYNLTSYGGSDLYVAKYDGSGNCVWVRQAGGTGNDHTEGISIDAVGNIYITGDFTGNASFGTNNVSTAGSQSIYLAKYDNNGNNIWVRGIGGSYWGKGYKFETDPNGKSYLFGSFSGTAIFGSTTLTSQAYVDIFVAKFDSAGNCLWAKQSLGNSEMWAGELSIDNYGNSYITGEFTGNVAFGSISLYNQGDHDVYLVKYDNLGNVIWARNPGGVSNDRSFAIDAISDGGCIITGDYSGTANFGTISLTSTGGHDIFIAKYDALGNCLWASKAGGTGEESGYGVAADEQGNSYFTGFFNGSAVFGDTSLVEIGPGVGGYGDMFVAKLDNSGNFLWVAHGGGESGWDSGCNIFVASNGSIYATGINGENANFGGITISPAGGIIAKISNPGFILPGWNQTITITNNALESKQLEYGLHPNATDGIDVTLGEISLPPVPPSSVCDVRFELPVTPVEYSIKDFRIDTLSSATWVIKIQSGDGGYPVTVSWDSSALPPGTFRLKDMVTGSIINVNMKAQSQLIVTNAGITALKLEYSKDVYSEIRINAGWNMVSIPVTTTDMRKVTLFPNATSNLFAYNNGYINSDTGKTGLGYWVRYTNQTDINICGAPNTSNEVELKSGWNMIGVYDKAVVVSGITTTPANILTSSFFGYNSGYTIPTTLGAGKGYWIRASQNGVMNLNTTMLAKGSETSIINDKWSSLIITDREGKSSTLYLSQGKENLSRYDLPPVPPDDIFDVRFATDRMVEDLTSSKEIVINSAEYPVVFRVEGLEDKVKVKVERGNEKTEKVLSSGESIVVSEGSRIFIERVEIPAEFGLSQNYPNPFNPSTVIRYQLPVDSKITLKLYDILGREVAVLVDEFREAGSYNYDLSMTSYGLSSGVYLYEMRAGEFRSVKKMVLMK